ncbi:MAG: PGL/p-HBAD biosynthesis glycosyltransferase [Desulfovibrio sp.]
MKFSIVMSTLNGAETLRAALASIFGQTYPKWEIIVQDGGSTDGTLAILEEYGKILNWRSEPDTGVYDAWNKALPRITGDWALFLGADDLLLHKHVFAQCARHLTACPERIQFAYGALLQEQKDAEGKNIAYNRSLRNVYYQFLQDMGLTFTSTFVRTSLFRDHSFDPAFKISGDYDFCARLVTDSNVARLPVWVSYMRRGGLSSSPDSFETLLREREKVLRTRIVPRAADFVLAMTDRIRDFDVSLEDIPAD